MTEQQGPQISSRFLERLLSSICHDVGAPTRHIVQFTKLLNDGVGNAPLEDKHHDWLSIIHDGGIQIQVMLSALSKVSRLSKSLDDTTSLDLSAIFHECLELSRAFSISKNASIEISTEGSWPKITAYKQHWHTLFSCLIENALIFQPKEREHITKVHAMCERIDSKLIFSIEDNGIGVPDSQLENMSRPFKQLNHKGDYPGIGMGLAYCEYIAELNNASLEFSKSSLGGLCVTYTQAVRDI